MTDHDPSAGHTERRTDGGDDATDERRGGWFSRLFPGRDERIRSLRRQLRQAERDEAALNEEVERLRGRVTELEEEKEELASVKGAYEQREFALDALLESVGESFRDANRELAKRNVAVGDLDVTLRADVSGGGSRDSLSLRLVDPEEGIDADRLSTLSFTVGGRGRLRRFGQAGTERGDTGAEGGSAAGGSEGWTGGFGVTAPDETASEPTGPPAEVPDVTGLPVGRAETELRAEGFGTHREYRPDATPVGTVVEQWPRAFAVAPQGSNVVVFVGGEERK
ncbi:hypothetical protein C2R22_18585 [Salinigranum rubrum]|uniref:PASTA domain-containing protein n=1 Tax=Salinigranum rubrum TaxID=755307 RepID=A0A2I8VN87_9EURY|nr:PASTA domain-containing protein [Salinigranum rubrum]AUV83402.1 hypothetical protein C2R22_18585 [Salinigranum rubrum]